MDWDEMARPWLEAAPDLETSFEQIFDALFGAAALLPGETVLDVGCGTGPTLVTASKAVGEAGRITGIDIAPPLLARAAERALGNVSLIAGDAGTHVFETADFDIVLANFGIMFFQDNAAAFANLRNAVRTGGRMAATVWATPSENPWFSVPRRIVDEIISDVPRPDIKGPGPMRFGDPSELENLLKSAGWAPHIETHDLDLLPPGSAEQLAKLLMKVNVGMMLKGVEATDTELAQIEEALTQAYRDFEDNGRVVVPARIHVVTARAV